MRYGHATCLKAYNFQFQSTIVAQTEAHFSALPKPEVSFKVLFRCTILFS